MRSEAVDNHRLDLLWFAFTAAAVLLGAMGVAKVAGLVRVQRVVAEVRSLSKQDPNDLQKSLRQAKETAETVKKDNLFVKQRPKENPIRQVDGILGSEALIGDKWYKVGDKVGDAEILAIRPTEVLVEWNGQKKTFTPIMAAGAEGPSGAGPGRPEPPSPPEPGRPEPQGKPAEAKAAAPPTEGDPLAWMGVTLSPKVRAMLLEQWNRMSDEQKEQMKEQWNKMPPEDRQRAMDSMEQHL
jgi:hypothetical protein